MTIAWQSVDIRKPPHGAIVIVRRPSGYTRVPWEILTAKYDPEYRPLQSWVCIDGSNITESGSEPTHWAFEDSLEGN